MRVVWLHTDLRIYWPARLDALGTALQARGDELHVVEIASQGSPYDFAGVGATDPTRRWSVLFEGRSVRSLSPRQMTGAVATWLANANPDVVAAGGIAFPSGAATVRWCRANRRGVIIFDNVRSEDVPRGVIVNAIKRRIYANVDAMLIPGPSHVESYLGWGLSLERLFYGLQAIDSQRFAEVAASTREKADEVRTTHKLPWRYFLGVGRLITQKNWEMVIRAYAAYRQETPEDPWGLVLIGDGEDMVRLQDIAKGVGADGIEMRGTVTGLSLSEHYALASCFVLPSYGETWGLVVNEAMASGLPVLVSDRCGCASTLVEKGVNGWTFAPDDVGELARLMVGIAKRSPSELRAMGRESERIISQWSMARFVDGALGAIDACREVRRGYRSWLDRAVISMWNGRYRPV